MSTAAPPPVHTGDGNASPRGVFEPPEGQLIQAIGWHKGLIAAVAVAMALIGAAIGLARPAGYEASATLQVGQVNPNSPGFFSYTQSASSLATAFSRAVAAESVLRRVEREVQVSAADASGRLSSEPIPLSPAFRVIATGSSEADAIELANAAAKGVETYVNRSNRANPEAQALLNDYRRASRDYRRAANAVAELEGSDLSTNAIAEKKAAAVRLKAIEAAYIATVSSEAPRAGLVSILAGATSASNDRVSKVELFAFLGLLLGLVLGCLLALLIERRRTLTG